MAVSVTRSGGIYIEISGDTKKLAASLEEAKRLANMSAKSIGEAFGDAFSERSAAKVTTGLAARFAAARQAAKGLKTDLSAFETHFKNMGRSIGLAGKELETFAQAQAQALQKKNADSFLNSLRAVQRETGLSNEKMNELSKSLGGVGNEFDKAARTSKQACINFAQLYLEAAKLAILKFSGDFFKESFDLAARYETLGVVVQQVGRTAGYPGGGGFACHAQEAIGLPAVALGRQWV